jgi:calcineurin-like phosphoesterase family protein
MKSIFYAPVLETGKNHQILFWGCLHYRHNPKWEIPLWKRRGFSSSEEHDAAIIDRWNSRASKETIGFLLGDNVFGYNAAESFRSLLNRLVFNRIYIMPGNHQAGWKQTFESLDENIYFAQHGGEVVLVPNYLEAYINGQAVVMSHYPILSWNGQAKGSWMLFSHVHGSLNKSEVGRLYLTNGLNKEVSVEASPYPSSFGDIKEWMSRKTLFSPDHHEKSNNTGLI